MHVPCRLPSGHGHVCEMWCAGCVLVGRWSALTYCSRSAGASVHSIPPPFTAWCYATRDYTHTQITVDSTEYTESGARARARETIETHEARRGYYEPS